MRISDWSSDVCSSDLSLGFVAPAARLGNAWDTRLGGVLADAITCTPVVKAFGAEQREETRLARTLGNWRHRTRRGWVRGSVNGETGRASGVERVCKYVLISVCACYLKKQKIKK